MASGQMQASKGLKKKGSPTIHLIQELIEENPTFEDKLDELKVSVSLAENRNAQLLEEKEDLILNLQGTALKNTRAAEKLHREQLSSSEKTIRELREKLESAEDEKRKLSREVTRGADAFRFGEQASPSETGEDEVDNELQETRKENDAWKKQESSLIGIITSLEARQSKGNVQVESGAQKRTYGDMAGGSAQNIAEAAPSRPEYEDMMPKVKVKHWAPDGYYHVNQNFRRKPVRKGAVASSKELPPAYAITVID